MGKDKNGNTIVGDAAFWNGNITLTPYSLSYDPGHYVFHEVGHVFDYYGSGGDPSKYKSQTFVDTFIIRQGHQCHLSWNYGCSGKDWKPSDIGTSFYGQTSDSMEDFADSFAYFVEYGYDTSGEFSRARLSIIMGWIYIASQQ